MAEEYFYHFAREFVSYHVVAYWDGDSWCGDGETQAAKGVGIIEIQANVVARQVE